MNVVFTNGVFDLLHVGHIALLYQARALGDVLVVGIDSDESVRRLGKGDGRPFVPAKERARIVSSIAAVSKTIIFGTRDGGLLALIESVRPAVLVKGGDYSRENVIGREFVESYGGRVEIIPLVEGVSTTKLVDRIRASCRDGGACHHDCRGSYCWRVEHASPLTSYGEEWERRRGERRGVER